MKILIVIDMQNDFLQGALRNEEAIKIIPAVIQRIKEYQAENKLIIATRDTHEKDYLSTQEGKNLPVTHCVKNTEGWQICNELKPYAKTVIDKPTFGSLELPKLLKFFNKPIEKIELCGLCTDICVISNAMILKAAFLETPIAIHSTCCAGVRNESHQTALNAMKAVQIEII